MSWGSDFITVLKQTAWRSSGGSKRCAINSVFPDAANGTAESATFLGVAKVVAVMPPLLSRQLGQLFDPRRFIRGVRYDFVEVLAFH